MSRGGGPPVSPASALVCSNCHRPYPPDGHPHRCPACGGLFDLASPLAYVAEEKRRSARGLESFRSVLPLPPDARFVSLGEGGTPLVGLKIRDREVFFKCEHLNPTGSFKDRGSCVLVS